MHRCRFLRIPLSLLPLSFLHEFEWESRDWIWIAWALNVIFGFIHFLKKWMSRKEETFFESLEIKVMGEDFLGIKKTWIKFGIGSFENLILETVISTSKRGECCFYDTSLYCFPLRVWLNWYHEFHLGSKFFDILCWV